MKWLPLLLILPLVIPTNSIQPTTWGYQLQNYDVDKLVGAELDVLVIDYSKDGTDAGAFTEGEIQRIKDSGKVVICYVSIGEAEDYRYYFQDNWKQTPPQWLGEENPDWEGNYKVHYWDPEWQAIVYDYIENRILSVGFDGIYMDIIDAYEYYEGEIPDAPQMMIDFVRNISKFVKGLQGDNFLVVPQNGEGLLGHDDYREVIDGIGKEDLYVATDGVSKQDISETEYSESMLDLLINDGKFVLTVDYTSDPAMIRYARESAARKGYTEYIGVRALDRLVDQGKLPTTEEGAEAYIFPSLVAMIVIARPFRKRLERARYGED